MGRSEADTVAVARLPLGMRRLRVLMALICLAASACVGSSEETLMDFKLDPKNFPDPTRIDNKYHPLVPGTRYFFEGIKHGVPFRTETVVSDQTKVVNGITARVVNDTDYGAGQVVETTEDWFAQDNKGNLWYLGEYATQYENGQVKGHEGSWESGVQGARAGVVMLGDPKTGTPRYRQEYRKGITEDTGKVVSVSDNLCVPYKCFNGNVLVVDETSPVEPGVVERKWYALGVGMIRWNITKGEPEHGDLVRVAGP